jgi:signal transduction histidine kinase
MSSTSANSITLSAADPRDLERLQRLASLGTLSAVLAHEVNNVLTPILSHAQMALQDTDDHARLIASAGRAAAGAKQAASIIDSVLRLAKGEPSSEAAHADVEEAICSALACLSRDPSKDGISIKMDLPEEDVFAEIAPTWLLQVLLNLILNARNAMIGKPGILTIGVQCSTWNNSETPTVAISIRDNGPGIPEDQFDEMFKPFASRNNTEPCKRTKPRRGAGLGLAISRQVIERAGGSLAFSSKIGQGTEFVVVLPRSTQSDTKQLAA